MKRSIKLFKRITALLVVVLLNVNSYAAVGGNDGSAFVTKAEFDAVVNTFNEQMDNYENGIISKVDGAIANYIASIDTTTTVTTVPYFVQATGSGTQIACRKATDFPFANCFDKYNISVSYDANLGNSGTIYGKMASWTITTPGEKTGKRVVVVKDGSNYYYAGYTTNYGEEYNINWSFIQNNKDDGFVDGNHYAYPFVFDGTQNSVFDGSSDTAWKNYKTFIHSGTTQSAMRNPTMVSVSCTPLSHTLSRKYDIVFSNNDNSTTGKQYVYVFLQNQNTKFIAGTDSTSKTVFSKTNQQNFSKKTFTSGGFRYIRYFGTTIEYRTGRTLTMASSYSGYSTVLAKYAPSTAPVQAGIGTKWSSIMYPDKTEYKYYTQASSGGAKTQASFNRYSMVQGLPLIDVAIDDDITWTYEFTEKLNGRKIYVKYGPFNGTDVTGSLITEFDASEATGEIKFKASRADMLFIKWTSGSTLKNSGSGNIVKTSYE